MVKKKKNTEKEVIHIKFDYGEAREGKKDLLYSQLDILHLIKTIKKYHELREKELDTKALISQKIKEVKKNINKIKLQLPKLKNKIIEKEEKNDKIISKRIIPKTSELEKELASIQEKLRRMEA